uniref:F-box domain-containing protein n=1 Tax=Caenorhabditis tropicalis TaxID=1561998 RepID=A0A1I7UV76_9PELO
MDRFSLFRLPAVVISEVMKMYHLFDIIMLSMCSKRARSLTKTFRLNRKAATVNVIFSSSAAVRIQNEKNKSIYFYITSAPISNNQVVNIGNSMIPMSIETKNSGCQVTFYFEDLFEGLKTVSEYFCSLFEKDVNDIDVSSSLNPNAPLIVMKWILERQERFHSVKAESETANDEVAKFFLENANRGDNSSFKLPTTSDFQIDLKFEQNKLEMLDCHWFSFDNLMNINCIELDAQESKLTNIEMNTFLKHWISTTLKFKMLVVIMEPMNIDVLLSGIPFIEQFGLRAFREHEYGNGSDCIEGGLDIQRNDGVWATINTEPDTDRTDFGFIVWIDGGHDKFDEW